VQIDTDLLQGNGIWGAIVGFVVTAGWWFRRERVESAKASEDVAAANAGTAKHEGQSAEIESLRVRVSTLDAAFVDQAAKVAELTKKVTALEASRIGAAMHIGNLLLCDPCQIKNKPILNAIDKALNDVDGEHEYGPQ
jgi:hypothetical protein